MNGKIRLLELFGGIGACTKAFERLGIDFEVADYVEIDKYAVRSYNAIHGTNFEPQDVTQWDKDIEVDFIMHGSPCQDFSLAGKQGGGDEGSGTRSSLMYETIRIVAKLKPNWVLWENVKNVISPKHVHNFEKYLRKMESLGYWSYWQVLNAKDYGIPQNRDRVFILSIRNDVNRGFVFPEKKELHLRLKDMLEDHVDEKYFLGEKMVKFVLSSGTKNFYYKPEIDCEIAKPLTATLHKMHRAGEDNYITVKSATKDGYEVATEGDSVNLLYPDSKLRRGRVGHAVSQTIQCGGGMGVVINDKPQVIGGIGDKTSNNGTQWYQQKRIYDDNVAISIATDFNPYYKDNLRIRKLTPKECWRLMGFDDEDFEKAEMVNSNTQLYKQAGNSIVVNVLEAILSSLFLDTAQEKQMTIFELMKGEK